MTIPRAAIRLRWFGRTIVSSALAAFSPSRSKTRPAAPKLTTGRATLLAQAIASLCSHVGG